MAGPVLALERTAQQYERSLDICNMHIGESLAVVYWIKGIYVPAALRDINYVLRDHHADGLAGRGVCTVWCWRTCIAAGCRRRGPQDGRYFKVQRCWIFAMQPTSQVAGVVGGVITLLLIATVVLAVTRRLKLPSTVVLVLVGIGLAAWSAAYPHVLPMLHDLELSSALIFYVFLPTLIFEAAFNLDVRQLYENLGAVLALAVPGLLLSTLIIGLIVGMATSIPYTAALLLGAILSATDPVAVIAVFRRLGTPQNLRVLVEGESLFNDATSVVLARILLGVVLAGTVSDQVIIQGAINFVIVFVGGLVVGWLLGLLTGYVIGKVEDHFIEITLTTVLAYVSYLVAEQVLGVSGVMATIGAGLTMGGWGRMKVSYAVRDYLEHFWEYVAFLANALIFLLVGLRVDLGALRATLGLLCWVVVAMAVSCAVFVYGLIQLV